VSTVDFYPQPGTGVGVGTSSAGVRWPAAGARIRFPGVPPPPPRAVAVGDYGSLLRIDLQQGGSWPSPPDSSTVPVSSMPPDASTRLSGNWQPTAASDRPAHLPDVEVLRASASPAGWAGARTRNLSFGTVSGQVYVWDRRTNRAIPARRTPRAGAHREVLAQRADAGHVRRRRCHQVWAWAREPVLFEVPAVSSGFRRTDGGSRP